MLKAPLFTTLLLNCVEAFTFTVPVEFTNDSDPAKLAALDGEPVAEKVTTPVLVSVPKSSVALEEALPIMLMTPAFVMVEPAFNTPDDCVGCKVIAMPAGIPTVEVLL